LENKLQQRGVGASADTHNCIGDNDLDKAC